MKGLTARRARNASLRAIGEEPAPGWDGGLKRYARWLKRAVITPITIKDPERYMHCAARANYWINTGQVG